ncbi:uncharacterized protein LOC131928088 isoform X3 [Physella acuta]|uniref:uncharacterized protein LOC131928088 isoform X3 n=1 Tax=Physella acuta TaxID=109671 RepID=UPI0027DCB74E|nr:uncharacterized protein LOC131928088 isoform X3 [Physella acuta]
MSMVGSDENIASLHVEKFKLNCLKTVFSAIIHQSKAMENTKDTNGIVWECSNMVKQELSDEIITFMDMKSDETSAISNSEGVQTNISKLFSNSEDIKQNVSTQFSTVKDKYLEETMPFLALEYKNLDKTKPLFNLEEMKQDNPTSFSSSEDMKPNISTAFSIFEDIKPEILTISSLENEQRNGFKAQQQLSSPPDSTDFKENLAVLKSDLQNELKQLKLLHAKLNDNLPTEYQINDKGLKTYKCDMCCQRFFHFDHVKQHINIHTRVNPYGHDFHQQEVVMISQGEQINKINLQQDQSFFLASLPPPLPRKKTLEETLYRI